MAEQDLDRNEAATPYKLQKAREKGQTPRSTDLASGLVFLAAMMYAASQSLVLVESMLALARSVLAHAAQGVDAAELWPMAERLAREAAVLLLPFLLLLPAVAVLAALGQTGMVFSLTPLEADFQRLNPAAGFRRLFSVRILFEAFRACLKLVILVGAAGLALHALLPQFQPLSAATPASFLRALSADVSGLGLQMGLALILVGALDVLYTRHEFGRNMRMSRRELKEEFRQREGDPRIRARLRDLRRELLKRSRALQNTRGADVVLTNPTHFAVALRYVHGEMPAPRVVAKGAGQLAAAMREIAARHHVVVVQNPPLARSLFRGAEIDAYIPEHFHAEVARIIVWVFAMRQQRNPKGATA